MEEASPYKGKLLEKCPECSSTNIGRAYDNKATYCFDCGLEITSPDIDKGPEWRAFTQEERESRSRVGASTSYSVHDKGLSTGMGRVDRDAHGRELPYGTRLQMYRLRKWQIRSRVHDSVDRNLAQAMAELDRLSDKLYIPGPIKEEGAVYYRKAMEKGLVRGRSIVAVTAAALYAACRNSETPRTLREIAEASLVDKKDVARCYRLFLRELDVQMPVADPITYVSKIAERVGISGQTQGVAIKILRDIKLKRKGSGKDPIGLGAAALYVACLQTHEKKTQKDIAEAAGVTEVTVRNRYKPIARDLGIDPT